VRQICILSFVVLPLSPPRLSNLYNAIPRTSSFRLPVYESLLNIATAKDELEVLQISQKDVQTWLSEWNITPEEKSAFLKSIVDAFVKTGQMRVCFHVLYDHNNVRPHAEKPPMNTPWPMLPHSHPLAHLRKKRLSRPLPPRCVHPPSLILIHCTNWITSSPQKTIHSLLFS
jgi:hypothetical protein